MSSVTEISSLLTSIQNDTEATTSANSTTGSYDLDMEDFLNLYMEQLQNQDPLDPSSTDDLITQTSQMTMVSELQDLNDSLTTSNSIQQACSLIGQTVSYVNPDDTTETLEGEVTAANFYSDGATVVIDGNELSLGYVTGVLETSSTESEESESEDNTEE